MWFLALWKILWIRWKFSGRSVGRYRVGLRRRRSPLGYFALSFLLFCSLVIVLRWGGCWALVNLRKPPTMVIPVKVRCTASHGGVYPRASKRCAISRALTWDVWRRRVATWNLFSGLLTCVDCLSLLFAMKSLSWLTSGDCRMHVGRCSYCWCKIHLLERGWW